MFRSDDYSSLITYAEHTTLVPAAIIVFITPIYL